MRTLFLFLLATHAMFAQAVRINCGGWEEDYTASDGTVWSPDRDYVDGDLLYTGHSIAGTDDGILFRTARQGLYTDFSYRIPVANDTYNVVLHFAEIRYSGPGQRIFNVILNNSPFLLTSTFSQLPEECTRLSTKLMLWP
jgi:hypothetical protein